jgi:uncharacterized protein (TIGR02246 family)
MSSIQPTPGSEAIRSSSASSSARDGIRAGTEKFTSAFAAGDAGAIAECYTSDAQVMPANSDAVRGQDAIANFWRSVIESGIAGVRIDTSEIETEGDLAVEGGRYTLIGADGGTLDFGKYLVVWHREGTGWKIHRDIWTTSRPAAAA